MARLINNKLELQAHLGVSAGFDFDKVIPFSKRAERKFVETQIGFEQLQVIIAHDYVEGSDLPINRVKNLLCEAASNYSMYLAFSTIETQVTNFGIKTTTTSQAQDADWKSKRDLKRSYIETANEAMDDALEIMEDNSVDFQTWKDSNQFTILKSFVVTKTKTFNDYFDIQKNRKTFLALKPYMSEIEEEFLLPMLGKCTLDFLKTTSIVSEVLRAKELLDRAVVALTVAKVANVGTFVISASSLLVMTEEMPWERSKLELSDEKLYRLRSDRQNSGQEYLKAVKKIIVANPLIFICYQDKIEIGLSNKIIQKKSHLML